MEKTRQAGRPRKPRPVGLSGQLGAAVEQFRKELHLDAEKLAQLAGLGLGTVIRVERGVQSPTLDTVLATAHALGKSAADLLAACPDWSEQPKKGKHHGS